MFCDRESETETLISNATNGVITTLLSIRRMGKTGLLLNTFYKLEKKGGRKCIYVDIFATLSLAEFTNQLASCILTAFPSNKSIGKRFVDFILGFSPVISYDAFTGIPEITLTYTKPRQYENTLKGIFTFLEQQDQRVVIAIDEFQQVVKYPEKNTEAVLRTIIQNLHNVSFIFSGSHKHIMLEIFSSIKRPFYSSKQAIYLGSIPKKKYATYIKRLFKKGGRLIDKESVDFILSLTRVHTYYTQALCNKIYSQNAGSIGINPDYSWVFRYESLKNNKIRCSRNILSATIAIAIGRTKI